MSYKLSTYLLACVCALGMTQSLWGQSTAASRGIRGYLDPRTGLFHALAPATDGDAEPAATKTVTGKLVFNFTITLNATLAATAKVACSVSANLEDNLTGGAPTIIEEEASALATKSGTTATCTVNIPYSWNLATSTTDMVNLQYTISAPAEATAAASLPNRLSLQSLPAIKVPVTGATTTTAVTATI